MIANTHHIKKKLFGTYFENDLHKNMQGLSILLQGTVGEMKSIKKNTKRRKGRVLNLDLKMKHNYIRRAFLGSVLFFIPSRFPQISFLGVSKRKRLLKRRVILIP